MTTKSSLGVPGFALVTGGGSGIGRAICRLLAREACSGICLADVNSASLEAVATELASIATNPQFRTILAIVDVRDEASVQKMIADSVAAFGRLDYAVNCAGIGAVKGPIADGSVDDWNMMIGVNMTGVWICVKEEIKAMREQEPRDNR
jgi:NAD(P)-dependent dehydrogenase (short-subunit alcohol dehydrogenase family)